MVQEFVTSYLLQLLVLIYSLIGDADGQMVLLYIPSPVYVHVPSLVHHRAQEKAIYDLCALTCTRQSINFIYHQYFCPIPAQLATPFLCTKHIMMSCRKHWLFPLHSACQLLLISANKSNNKVMCSYPYTCCPLGVRYIAISQPTHCKHVAGC